MKAKKHSKASKEVFKYPYCARSIESDDGFLSEKICSGTIQIRQKFVKNLKWLVIYVEFIIRLRNGVVPSQVLHGMGLPVVPQISQRMNYTRSDTLKNLIIAQVIRDNPDKILFNEKQIDLLYDLALKCRINSITKEELLTELRGGDMDDVRRVFGAVGFVCVVIIVINNWQIIEGFQAVQGFTRIRPPHLQLLDELFGNQRPRHDSGYGTLAPGPRSITVVGMTQNAGSEKKDPSSGSFNFKDVMDQIYKQVNKRKLSIEVGNEMYSINNTYEGVSDLKDLLAEKIYNSIRESHADVFEIARNLGFKPTNIKLVKDHVFYNFHKLDRYVNLGVEPQYRRFDPILEQALAWLRLQSGTHIPYTRRCYLA